ncbi:MAG: hypothetical protein HQL08_11080 [Nitrospirae bacterium]|nr:hypothetical protein [Nitrospirota bacterium]
MAFKAFEFGGMGLFKGRLFAGSVAGQAFRAAFCLYIPVKDIVRNARITFSRDGIQYAKYDKNENNKTYCAFH